jgi:hypothetical protein
MMNYRDNIRVDADLLLEFFLTFARAEFALKNSGFVKGDQRQVLADWDSFAESLENNFRKDKNKSLSQAVNYIMDNPPMRQVLRDSALMWDANRPNGRRSEIEVLLLLVRRIRNNLFHGGKHNLDVFEDTERTTRLLRNSIIVIHECLLLEPSVKAKYDEATI